MGNQVFKKSNSFRNAKFRLGSIIQIVDTVKPEFSKLLDKQRNHNGLFH